jgi:predicted permease
MLRPGIRRLFRLRLGRREDVERETDDEIRAHLEMRAEALERRGLSPEEAMAEARRRFGELEPARDDLVRAARRRERRVRWRDRMDGLRRDARHAWRSVTGEPGLAAVVIVIIALGVGANAAMFGILDRLLLGGPAHVVDPGRLVRFSIHATVPGQGEVADNTFGYVTYAALRDHARGLDGVAAYSEWDDVVGQGPTARPVRVGHATAGFFPLLGVRPAVGRFFGPSEDRPGDARRVAVLGHLEWEGRFAGDSSVIGRTVRIGGEPYTVVGVAPAGFTGVGLQRVDAWLPMSLVHPAPDWRTSWQAQWLKIVARLSPGATRERAGAGATRAFRAAYPGTEATIRRADLRADPLSYDDSGHEALEVAVSRWLFAVSLIVLLVACANVANLLLARALRRRREVSVRLALGISRGRLVRLLLGESLALAFLGGVAALAVIPLVGRVVRSTLLPGVAWSGGVYDGRVLAVAAALTLATGLAAGLLPALHAGRHDVIGSLRAGMRGDAAGTSRLRSGLAVAQAALSVVLLVGAGLFVRSLDHARGVDLGFEPDRVLMVRPDWSVPGPASAPTAEERDRRRARRKAFFDAGLARARRLPGVEQAAVTIGLPFQMWFTLRLRVPGLDSIPKLPGGGPYIQAVSPGYFATMGLSLLEGRAFGPSDHAGSEPVAVVSRTMARTLWPGGEAVGRCLLIGRAERPPCARVVGVVEDAHRNALHERPSMQYYIPLGQESGLGGSALVIRPRGDPEAEIGAVRRSLAGLDPEVLYLRIETLESVIDPRYRPWRLGATLMGAFGLLALLIATVGLYSLVAYTVASRRHEVGIRMALGAGRLDILRWVLRRGLLLVASGVAIGALLAAVAAPRLGGLLFEESPLDPVVFAGAAALLMAVAVAACLVPAGGASRLDPVRVLRAD